MFMHKCALAFAKSVSGESWAVFATS